MLDNQRRYHTLRRRLMYERFWSFMICVSADETDDGLNSKTEDGQWRQLARLSGRKIVRSGMEEQMEKLKRAGLNG